MELTRHHIRKVGIFRALQLGDLLCSMPAIRALKKELTHAEIYLIGLPSSKSFVERFSDYFTGLYTFPGLPGLPEQAYDVKKIVHFIQTMQEERFDLILQMQGNGTLVNQFVELLNARYTAGFYMENDYSPPGDLFIPYPDKVHEIQRHLLLMQHLGVRDTDVSLEFPITREDEINFRQLHLTIPGGQYVCVHPGSRGGWRQWPPGYFASLADLAIEAGKKVIITGTPEELPIVEAVAGHMRHQPVIAAGKTDLGCMALLIKNAFCLISNCTGVSHIAAALETPSIIISMDGEPERWAPLNKDLHYTIDWTQGKDFQKVKNKFKALLASERTQGAGTENL